MMGQTMLIRNAEGDYTPAHRSLLEFFVAYKFAAELGALAPDFLELAKMRSGVDGTLEAREYCWSEYFQRCRDTQRFKNLASFSSESLQVLKSSFGSSPLTKAVTDLLIPMLSNPKILFDVLRSTRGNSASDVGYSGGNIACTLE
jgi:predicted NACHT family NTPase